MHCRIAVIYASKYGSTKEIAEIIAGELNLKDYQVTLYAAHPGINLNNFDVVILGSALYMGKWRSDAVMLLKENMDILSKKAVWLFVSGPTGDGDAEMLSEGKIVPDNIKPIINRISPKGLAVFHGNLDMKELNIVERILVKMVKAPLGDFRKKESIQHWTIEIIKKLNQQIHEKNGSI
ncbi:MAG TPA: flavodoxin domain-containing protein [Bacteroidales bacterium]|nr:flavodoxin domain-containing protein [Bacteroidales bacterium]HRX98257.1 flavodoxin domain-containing protein [Bacteroidales bacterium]